MDPVTMATVAAVTTAAGTAVGAYTSYQAANAQADADKQRAAVEAQWAERRSLEERAAAQRTSGDELRKARLAQSRLGAVAGASGSGASDPTVMNLFQGIEAEGSYNAAAAKATGDQRAAGIDYQSALDRWTTDANSKIKKSAARGTLIGGMLGAAGQLGSAYAQPRMAMKYGGSQGSSGTGYGR